MSLFSQSLCIGEHTLQELENAVQPVKTPNRSFAPNNTSDSDVIEESPTNSTIYSLRERKAKNINKSKSKSIVKKNKIKSFTCKELPTPKVETIHSNDRLSQFLRSEYDFNDDFSKILPGNFNDLNSKIINCDNVKADEKELKIDKLPTCETDMFEDSSFPLLCPTKPSTQIKVNERKDDSKAIIWDDSYDFNDLELSSSEDNKDKGLELNFLVDEHVALGLDNVTFTQNFLNEASFENDLDLKNVLNSVPTSKFIEEEMESCKQSFNEFIRDECQQPNPANSQLCLSNANISGTSFVLNYSEDTEENEEKHINPIIIEKRNTQPLPHLNNISSWGLPASIVREYHKKGIFNMFDWQKDCLSNPKVLFENSNLVYCAPTSAGKTLVSEILMIKNVLEKQKKVLMILPFVSVVREKMVYLQDLLTSSGIQVEGYFGGYSPRSFDNVHVAVCTIEKANSILNKLLEQNKIDTIGCIVVDEVHLISDPSRGYILELLLSKILYVNQKIDSKIQIITMSATLPNLDLLTNWLHAEFFHTDFRPVELKEMIKINNQIFDNKMQLLRSISNEDFQQYPKDPDNIGQLCVETILENCSVIVFCPSKNWCEDLANHLARFIHYIGKSETDMGLKMREQIKSNLIEEVKAQLRNCPTGLDSLLDRVLSYGCAYHHAGLTSDERDIIENGFKMGSIRVIIATSTLSSGVNLPARRVIIRNPKFFGKTMNALTYKQMIGRAGRTGKDTLGESILICDSSNRKSGEDLIDATLKPLASCLDMDNCVNLKRAILEIIASGMATTKTDLEAFCDCTLLSSEKQIKFKYEVLDKELQSSSGKDIPSQDDQKDDKNPIETCMRYLIKYEFIRLQMNENTNETNFIATRLGNACLASSIPPSDGFLLLSELQKSRQCFVLETELHAIYLVTPFSVLYQMQDIDWLCYLDMWEKLPISMRRVGELVGVKESFFVKAMRGHKLDYKALQIHKRFYIALALQELVSEKNVTDVANKFKCSRGILQSLQQMASTFAATITSFCKALDWTMLATIITQFKERLFFGVHQDLIDLMKIPNLNSQRARSLFNEGIKNLADLANSDLFTVEKILYNSICFDTKLREGENQWEANQRNNLRFLFVTGKSGLTIREAATEMIENARRYLELEMGVQNIVWSKPKESQNENEVSTSTPRSITKNTESNSIDFSSQQFSDTLNDRKRKRDDGDTTSQLFVKKLRGISPEHEQITDQFTCVKLNSYETSNTQISNSSYSNALDSHNENGTIQFKELNIINVFGNLEFFNQFKTTISKYNIVGVSVGVNQLLKATPIIGLNTLVNRVNVDDEKIENYNCTFGENKFIAGVSLCLCDSTVYYLNLQNETSDDSNISFDMKKKFLIDIFHMKQLTLVIFDTKEQCKALMKCFPQLRTLSAQLRDPMVAKWILEPDIEKSLLTMVRQYAPECANITQIAGINTWKKSISLNCESTVSPKIRSSIECCVALHVLQKQMEQMNKVDPHMASAFTDIEMPIQRVLCLMELAGFPVNDRKISEISNELSEALKNLEKNIFKLSGKSFKISSTKEVAKVLKICSNKPNGLISTSRKVLEKLNDPIADLIIQYRTVESTLTKIMQPLILQIVNQRIHPRSNCFTSTGRITMHDSNLQNVTNDFEILTDSVKKTISCRRVFQVRPENQLVSADFCQVELRILTHFSGDQTLTKIIRSNCDVFKMIAAEWNNINESDVTEKQRNDSKQICYGIIYGMGSKALAESMNCDETEAQKQQELFHRCYPGIGEKVFTRARECGFVETICGRRRYLPHINSNDSSKRAQAERQALNTTIQGSAADIQKCAMLEMDKNLRQKESTINNVNLVLHMHDELVYEAPKSLTKEVVQKLKASMEKCKLLNVPLRVKLKVGNDWGSMKEINF